MAGEATAGTACEREPALVPDRFDERFVRVFTWYGSRLVRRRFNALRIERASHAVMLELADERRPMIVLLNHSSWWDPITGLVVCRRLLGPRSGRAPMERDQLQRFRFMRRLGMFGIDPGDARSLDVMAAHVLRHFEQDERPTLVLTPQGEFTDVRVPIRIRPGAAAIASRAGDARVLSFALEYVFWQNQRPEILVRVAEVRAERTTTAGWHRAMQATMQDNADALATLSIARDPEAFEVLIGGRSGRINPVYDLLLRLRGRGGEIAARRSD